VRYAFIERHRGTRPIVVQCSVLQVSASGYRSVTGTARLSGQSALGAIRDLVDGNFAVA